MKLADANIAALTAPQKGIRNIYDTHPKSPPSFGIYITSNGIRTFFLTYRTRSGIQRDQTIGRFPAWSVSEARLKACEIRRAVDNGYDPKGDDHAYREAPTIDQLAERYIEEHAEPKKRPASVYEDKSIIKKWIEPELGHFKVIDVKRRDIQALHQKITKYGTPARANSVVALLSKMFSLSIQWEMRTDNPCKGVERNRDVRRNRFLSHEELAALIEAMANHPNQAMANVIRLLLLTGARRSEALKAEWSQFDLKAGTWTKPAHTTKQKALHHVPLSNPALRLLLQIRAGADSGNERAAELEQEALRQHFPHRRDALFNAATRARLLASSVHVFPGYTGTDRPLNNIDKFWDDICKTAGLTDCHIHDLRHSYASFLASAGVPLYTIGALLGHTQPSTTARYAHLLTGPLKLATDQAGAVITAAESEKSAVGAADLTRQAE
jgi:integrase